MKHLLLLGMMIAFTVIMLVVLKLKSNSATTISLNATKHPAAFLTIAIGVSAALICAGVYYVDWLQPTYNLTTISTVLFFGIILSFAATSWVPDVVGAKRQLHRGAAYVAVFIMPLFLLSLLTTALPGYITAVIIGVIVAQVYMLYLFLFVPKAQQWFLLFQGLYLAVFFAVLLLMTYGV